MKISSPLPSTKISSNNGSVMIVALITVTILSVLLGIVMRSVGNKYNTAFQVASWQEALFAAEAGADIAMAEMRKDTQLDTTAWTNWSVLNTSSWTTTGEKPSLTLTGTSKQLFYTGTISTHAGEGNSTLSVDVAIDAPATLKDGSGQQWYRVRATGKASIPGAPRVSSEKLDNLLRRLSLVNDYASMKKKGTNTKLAIPQATRTIECIAKPSNLFSMAMASTVSVKNDGAGLVVDSFDSKDTTKSTNGLYDSTKRQSNGDIGSNAYPIKHDKTVDLKLNNDYIFGDVGNNYSKITGLDPSYFNGLNNHPSSNTNPLIQTNGNSVPTGLVQTSYYRDLPRIKDPTWTVATNIGTLDKKVSDVTVSSDPSNPTRVIMDAVNLSKDTWTTKLASGKTDGYVQVWVKGDMTLKDQGIIVVPDGVHMTVYFDGNVKISDTGKGGGFDVQSDNPADLILLGVEQPDKTKKNADQYVDELGNTTVYTPYKATGNISIKDGDFCGAVYAPDHNFVMDVKNAAKRLHANGRARLQTGIDIYGSVVARTINAKGPVNWHYDEELASVGPINDMAYVSWYEDLNLDKR